MSDETQELTPKQAAFVLEYLKDLNGTQAAIRAGYSEHTARAIACELLGKQHIADAVAAAKAERAKRLELEADDVLRRLWSMATADPRELVEYRRTCCRYCWGYDFGYQFTAGEMKRERRAWLAAKNAEPFDEQGGVGYNATKAPNPDCPECFGEGVERQFVHDTRKLSKDAVILYAGVKTTKDGIEVRINDQKSAVVDVGRHLGMFIDKKEILLPPGTGVLAVPVPDAASWAQYAKEQQEKLTSKPVEEPPS